MHRFVRRALYLLRLRQREAELIEEMDAHRAMAERDLAAAGIDPSVARFAAQRTFGSALLAQDRSRDIWIPHAWQGLGQDIRIAIRTLWKTRLVSIVALLSLALGIGANTAIFALVNAVVLRALPARDPGRLALLAEPGQFRGVPLFIGYAVWEEIRSRTDLFERAAVWSPTTTNLSTGERTELVDTLIASGSFFDGLGVPAIGGRAFSDSDDASVPGHAGAEPVAVISYALWQHRFGGAADTIGRSITLDHVPFTIIGVTPEHFFGPEPGRAFDVIVPIGTEPRLHPRESWPTSRSGGFRMMVRLKPGEDIATATAGLRRVQPQIREATMPSSWPPRYRDQYLKVPFTLVPVADAQWMVRRRFERPLVTMLAIVMLVLLVACGNIASLMLARARARRSELRIRTALGASRWRLVRQLLAESALLAGAGGGLGLALAAACSRLLVRQISSDATPIVLDVSIDARVVAFTLALGIVTVLVFGVVPTWRYSRTVGNEGLNAEGRETARDTRDRVASVLVIAQVAVSLALVVAAGLMGRTFGSLAARQLGFEAPRVVVANISAQHADIAPNDREVVYQRLLDAVRVTPDVTNAAVSFQTPIVSGAMLMQPIEAISGGTLLTGPQNTLAALNIISPDWFKTLGIPIVRGRDLSEHDRPSTPPVAVVNQAFARRFLNGGDPVGHTATLALPGPPRPPVEIVGLAGDTVYGTLRGPVPPTIYLPLPQLASVSGGPGFLVSVYLTVRVGHGAPATVFNGLAAAITSVNPDLTFRFHTVDEQIADALTQERVLSLVSGSVGGLALLLAALGLYGVAAYAVARRHREFGIRLALGATPRAVVRLVLHRVALLVTVGVTVGTLISVWAFRLMASLLYNIAPRDPTTIAAAICVLGSVAAIATWAPARRAASIDPAVALRCE